MGSVRIEGSKIQMNYYEAETNINAFLSVEDWEEEARRKLGAGPFGYVHGGAGAGHTMRANLEAFYSYRIVPRICSDISHRDLSVELLGMKVGSPFLLAPIGVNSILHPDAELAPAKAAAKFGIPYILSNVSSKSMEEVAEAAGDSLRWFQLYPPKDRRLTASLLSRAEKSGYAAIVVTVDSTMLGWRETDLHNSYLPFLKGHGMGNYFTDPIFKEMLEQPPEKNLKHAVLKALEEGNNTCFTWKEFDFIKSNTRLPVLVKGLTHPEDAREALQHGVDGIVVSNHGGRQLDGAIGTLEALPEIIKAVDGAVPVLLDSGIRRGADVIKAIALGAAAVLIGRPYAYALAVAGQAGVEAVIQKLYAETEIQLGVSGKSRIRDLDANLLQKMP
ncbi:alpha-hydroxy-acid oxidizing protein [Paenibacillus thermotolerans]|uniref:alpha-hydroxy-acid oxidizing protein n=1 Tax=Paenibacillus thermotolerans TaxID=3027807 RepID=UPI0023684244|nr:MULTISPECIES: alpha-hydroxy-acid oxidizing protein [unclassified Paenibacillus]